MTAPDELRDLDRRIAEAMGMTVDGGPAFREWQVPTYSTSWQHAGPLLEEMNRGVGFALHLLFREGHHLVLLMDTPQDPVCLAECDTLTEAVARAYLALREARG